MQINYLLAQATQHERSGPMPWSLEYAISHGQTSVAEMLLKMGADANELETDGARPLYHAALHSDPAIVQLLLAKGADPALRSKAGTLPIHDAAMGKDARVIRLLVDKGADVSALTLDAQAQTPLHIAASFGRLEVIEALLALGAPLDVKDRKGRTPLDVAVLNQQDAAASLLRKAGDPKAKGKGR
jgi:ankyrin repeat protein